MINNDNLFNNKEQLALSYEVLCLLRWLVEHDANKFKKIIMQALRAGLKDELQKIDTIADFHSLNPDIQDNIADFFGLLEESLFESINELVEKKAREKNLLPAIDQIDTSLCDDATVRFSVEKTTKKLEHNPDINPKDQLFKELLKRWKPHNKIVMN